MNEIIKSKTINWTKIIISILITLIILVILILFMSFIIIIGGEEKEKCIDAYNGKMEVDYNLNSYEEEGISTIIILITISLIILILCMFFINTFSRPSYCEDVIKK